MPEIEMHALLVECATEMHLLPGDKLLIWADKIIGFYRGDIPHAVNTTIVTSLAAIAPKQTARRNIISSAVREKLHRDIITLLTTHRKPVSALYIGDKLNISRDDRPMRNAVSRAISKLLRMEHIEVYPSERTRIHLYHISKDAPKSAIAAVAKPEPTIVRT